MTTSTSCPLSAASTASRWPRLKPAKPKCWLRAADTSMEATVLAGSAVSGVPLRSRHAPVTLVARFSQSGGRTLPFTYNEGSRRLQDSFDTRRLADRLDERFLQRP